MAKDPVSGEFTRMLDMTVQALRGVDAPRAGDDSEPAPPAIGEAADGQVRAELGPDGRLQSLWIEPRLMRLGSEDLAEHITAAVNAAMDAMRGGATTPQVGDLSQLREQLEQVRDTAVPRLSSFLQALTEAQDRLSRGGPR